MGKDWLNWIVGNKKAKINKMSNKGEIMNSSSAAAGNCMCAVFQLFDLHHFQIPLNHQPSSSDSDYDRVFIEEEEAISTASKGVEAPRNSLELENPPAMKVASTKEEANLNFHVGMLHIKTSHHHDKISSSPRISTTSKSRLDDDINNSSEYNYSSSSPAGTKTPTLVARLMGLDLLPAESTSPSYSNPHKIPNLPQRKDKNILQKKPNTSFFNDDISVGARLERRSSDVEYHHHRLSLQVLNNKENMSSEEFGISGNRSSINRGRLSLLQDQENRVSAGHYAKQIVKQVRESVGKRMGTAGLTDITNKDKFEYSRRDENLILLKPTKKNSKIKVLSRSSFDHGENISPDGTPSCSPRLRFLEITNKSTTKSVNVTNSDTKSPRVLSCKSQLELVPNLQEQQNHEQKGSNNFGSGKKKKEEKFVGSKATSLVQKKSKKKSFSGEILNISGPILLPVKKDSSPPATKLPQKQSQVSSDDVPSKSIRQLSSNPNHSYNSKCCATTFHGGAAAEHKNYIQRILRPHVDFKPLIDKDQLCRMYWFFEEEERESIVCDIETEIVESLVRETVSIVVSMWRLREYSKSLCALYS